jgi:YVTN family beta-propeller protein
MRTRRLTGFLALIGGVLLSLASFAHAAPFAYITQMDTNRVTVLDTANNSVVTTLEVGFTPFGVAVHPSGSHVYVTNMDDNTVSVIETAFNTVVATVPVETSPSGLAVHPNGSRLYVANQLSDSVSVIDTATNLVVGTLSAGERPLGVAVNPAGTRLYVVNNVSFTVSVIDIATPGSETVVATVSVGQRPVGVAVDPTGSRVYVTNAMSGTLSVLDAATNTLSTTVTVGTSPRGVAVHPTGSHVYVANGGSAIVPGTVSVVATSNHAVVASPAVANSLYGIGVTPAGGHVVVASQDGGVFVLDTATNVVSGPVAVPDGPTAFGLFITPSASSCDTTALEQALAAAQQQLASLQAANQALISENGRLRSELTTARATIVSFVTRLFGDRTDGNVAAAARAAALADLTAARAAAPRDWRVRRAQQSFDHGEQAMRRRDWSRAVHEFREVHAITEWIVGDRHDTQAAPAPVANGRAALGLVTTPAGGSCDTAALEQALAAALRQIASLQAANQALTTENGRLRSELTTARATITSFVNRLFGERTDGNVAAAARDAALAELTAARAASPNDRRLRPAQHSFDQGQNAMRKNEWGRAVHEFRQAHEIAERILHDKHHHKHGKW